MDNTLILNFGDSQGEVYDYIFYYNTNYIKYTNINSPGWRSGWSLRGLNKTKYHDILFKPLYDLSSNIENVFIFLTFGSVDIEWNLSYKRFILKENPDTYTFIDEMINSFKNIIDKYILLEKNLQKIKNINFHIIITFPFIPLPLSESYMKNFSNNNNTIFYDVISHHERFYLWYIYCNKLISIIKSYNFKRLYIIDIRNDFIKKGFQHFMNLKNEDHHPNFLITKEYIITQLNNLTFYDNQNRIINLENLSWNNNFLYSHIRRPL
uniref:SGNH hydrolase-type esterase domain-containing protein n=1 Tax=viral metagenome TaxID=1070528 RepID=A0A6C0AZD1_9ZZZZ|tara:strand:- start:41068 stop:41865 length:798 start_codon:yes stop_codon:yes gene_type:complete